MMQKQDTSNLMLAILLSLAVLLGFNYFVERPRLEALKAHQQRVAQIEAAPALPAAEVPLAPRPREEILAEAPRLNINSPNLHGSLSLRGGRLDDLTLANYRETLEKDSQEIVLFAPAGSKAPQDPYYAEFGWLSAEAGVLLPDANTLWQADQTQLTPENPVRLWWENGQGLRFEKTIALDAIMMFTITQRVINSSNKAVTLYPYSLLSRHRTPFTHNMFILHEGPIGVTGQRLQELTYADMQKEPRREWQEKTDWLGFTDKYWLAALVPQQAGDMARLVYTETQGLPRYQADIQGAPLRLAAGAAAEVSVKLFAGAKETRMLDYYADTQNIHMFDRAIDFGWFYFLTKPFFHALDFLGRLFGNFGIAILVFTVIVKLLFFPLANKSYESMSKLRALQPDMLKIRERFEKDPMRMNQEMMTLYQREKVNPMSGCLPMLVQIPVFFALYKVLFVNIEMRHAPFFGWVQDLSAPDPTNLFTLFGLLPWDAPGFLQLGAWPILMGVTMVLQMHLQPQPMDKLQQRIFMFLPVIFTFMLAHFAVGLVIYWAWSNLLSIGQQALIMQQMARKDAKKETAPPKQITKKNKS